MGPISSEKFSTKNLSSLELKIERNITKLSHKCAIPTSLKLEAKIGVKNNLGYQMIPCNFCKVSNLHSNLQKPRDKPIGR